MATKDIEKYSNPAIVRQMADRYLGEEVPVYLSSRQDKKYMVQSPEGKWIHFGAYGMEDYTKHRNRDRREAFRVRNRKWASADKWTPAFMSYFLLW
jgi:hypothetical protein